MLTQWRLFDRSGVDDEMMVMLSVLLTMVVVVEVGPDYSYTYQ
jgi:hypothetical protein